MLKHGFNGTIYQFIKSKFIARGGDLIFLNAKKVWNDLSSLEKGDVPPDLEKID